MASDREAAYKVASRAINFESTPTENGRSAVDALCRSGTVILASDLAAALEPHPDDWRYGDRRIPTLAGVRALLPATAQDRETT